MPDILCDVPVPAPVSSMFEAISTPAGLDAWWTKSSKGEPAVSSEYTLGFGPEYDWRAEVTQCEPGVRSELEMRRADIDWTTSRAGASRAAPGRSARQRPSRTARSLNVTEREPSMTVFSTWLRFESTGSKNLVKVVLIRSGTD